LKAAEAMIALLKQFGITIDSCTHRSVIDPFNA
jgi:hypothetical protein